MWKQFRNGVTNYAVNPFNQYVSQPAQDYVVNPVNKYLVQPSLSFLVNPFLRLMGFAAGLIAAFFSKTTAKAPAKSPANLSELAADIDALPESSFSNYSELQRKNSASANDPVVDEDVSLSPLSSPSASPVAAVAAAAPEAPAIDSTESNEASNSPEEVVEAPKLASKP